MKFFLLFILILPSFAIGQDEPIPPKANAVLIMGVSFSDVCQRLIDSGYVLDKKDSELQTALTQFRKYPKSWNAGYSIYVRVKDSVATLTCTFTAPFNNSFLSPQSGGTDPLWKNDPSYHVTNRKGETVRKSLIGLPFVLMNDFALSFGKPIQYKTL